MSVMLASRAELDLRPALFHQRQVDPGRRQVDQLAGSVDAEVTGEREGRLRRLGSLRTLWPFVRRHLGLFIAWLAALAVSALAVRLADQG